LGTPVAVSVIDMAGRVIHSNARALDLTGRQLGTEMPAGLDAAIDIFHPDGRLYERAEWPAVRSLASGEEVHEEEFFYALPGGGRLFVRCGSSAMRDRDGGIVAAVLTQTDVTEQKAQESRLTSLEGLLDNTEDAIVAMDELYVLTVWNRGAERLYGWTADEVLGRHADEVARTNLSEDERTEMRRELAATGRWRGELRVLRKDGGTVEAELISVALRGELGDIAGYLTIHRDLTERRRDVATILESITDAFVAVDADWRYTYVNDRALARMRARKGVALARKDVIGRGMWEMFPEASGTEAQREYEQAMRERRPVSFETFFADSGQWIESHAYPSKDGLAIYYRDVTARRRGEEALREAEAQRADADRRLDEVREAERSRIARDLHDDALQGLTHALALTGRHAPGRDDDVAAVLEQVGRQLRAAIYDLRLEPQVGRPFADALREVVELTQERAPGCVVTLEVADDVPTASFGRRGSEVLRIVGEALANACRHADADRIVLRAGGPETGLVVEVADDGRGFDPAHQPAGILHGQGLRGMRERAELLGAELDVRGDEAGTTIRLEVSLVGS
jgi:PAS domain S-box-containing protein